ncbi:Peptidase M23 (fragment) [Verrucomicrobia bacterium]
MPGALASKQELLPRLSTEPAAVKVRTQRQGEVTQFLVENQEYGEITMTFEIGLVNLKGDVTFPYTVTLPAQRTTEAFELTPIRPEAKWEFSYTNYYKLGSACAQPDEDYVYELPYQPGSRFTVTQGYNGSFSHQGANQYAIDWKMPEGTPVCAARGGIVVRVKDDSHTGGSSAKYDRCNNYVLIRHADGTLGHYCHLQAGGCTVQAGQSVSAGQVIARSGNTGFSSGPHLHFCVFKNRNGRERESLPVKFRTADQAAITPIEGRTYQAAALPLASPAPLAAQAPQSSPLLR